MERFGVELEVIRVGFGGDAGWRDVWDGERAGLY